MKINHIKVSHFIMALIALLYFSDSGRLYLTNLDEKLFFVFNSTLGTSLFWDHICMALNHKAERVVSVLIMAVVTISTLFFAKDAKEKRIFLANSITVIIFVEIFMLINFILFSRLLPFERLSPSIVYAHDFISLQEMFNSTDIKVSSTTSFLGDHAFVATAWALMTLKFAPKSYKYLIIPIWFFICTGRLFAGAHWFTDVAFAICFAYLLFSYVNTHKIWYWFERKILSLVKKFNLIKEK